MFRYLLILSTLLLYISVGAAYFDEWWHADGRVESFFTIPHAILYSSIFTNGIIVLGYVLFQMKKLDGLHRLSCEVAFR
ncbi:hypothetical protein [Effusibacillus consociatus]|uniref:Uncharacterized protein n=1 Tax=Effusibacillus consociatus TaxID=1117041 RepID=A0ABV9PYP8_9BACL